MTFHAKLPAIFHYRNINTTYIDRHGQHWNPWKGVYLIYTLFDVVETQNVNNKVIDEYRVYQK